MHDQDQSLWTKPCKRGTDLLTAAAHIASDKWFRYPDQLTVEHSYKFGFSDLTNSEPLKCSLIFSISYV